MKNVIFAAALALMSWSSSSWACAPLAQGLEPAEMMSNLEMLADKISEKKPFLKDHPDRRFRWHEVRAEVGAEGNCNAISIDGRVNVSFLKERETCVYSAEIAYTDFMTETLTVNDVGVLTCF